MQQESIVTPIPDVPQEARETTLMLEQQYPGLRLSMAVAGKGAIMLIRASGPCGRFRMLTPNPLRGATLTALCDLACKPNLEGEAS